MDIVRLLASDNSWQSLCEDWTSQCNEIGDCFETYAPSSFEVIKRHADTESQWEWALGVQVENRFMAIAYAHRTMQKPFEGHVLRIREVTVSPFLDYGKATELEYSNTLIALLNGAVKLSETSLRAKHIKMHLRSPADSVFFRAFGNTLDSKGVFASTEAHGAWLTIPKQSPLKTV